jgi:hypothetical protein
MSHACVADAVKSSCRWISGGEEEDDGEKDETFGFIMQPGKAFIHIRRCSDQPEE